jgi:tripartite-type tricarboxylate transporter receptor subunit TctC
MLSLRRLTLAVILCAIVALAVTAAPSLAQTLAWPQRPVHFILPLGPGAGVDIVARMFADKLSARWGQPVVVENRPGGDAIVAITSVISAHDDHVLLFAPASTFTAHPLLHAKLSYDINELAPIARVTNALIGLGVPTSLNVGTVKEFVAKLRAEPGKLNYASATGANDLLFVSFLKTENLNMARVPYRDTSQVSNDLAEGRVHAYVAAYAIMRPQVQAGKVKLLALINRQRAAVLPDIPTSEEAGYKTLTMEGLIGLLGPRDMPLAIRERIAADIRAVAADPMIVERLGSAGQVVNPGTSAEFAADIADQRVTVARIGNILGITLAQ